MKVLATNVALISLSLVACQRQTAQTDPVRHKVVAISPWVKAVTVTERYVGSIQAQRHINVRALKVGYLDSILVREGQRVKEGDLMFTVIPVLYQKNLDAEMADVKRAQVELNSTKKQYENKVVSEFEVARSEAKLEKASAMAERAAAELNFATVKAPFDGIVDRLKHQQGSLVQHGDVLTTLSDNSSMWVYFNVPESRYLEYMADPNWHQEDLQIELVLANGKKFEQVGKFGAIHADFDATTGTIPFRADFPNPDRLLRHGQSGNVLIHRVLNDVIVIPQRSTFEIAGKRFVYVIDKENVAQQREIVPQRYELEDLLAIKSGLDADDKIVLDGIRQVRDGEKVDYQENQSEP